MKYLILLLLISTISKAQTVSVSVTDAPASKDTSYKVIEFTKDNSVIVTETKVSYKDYAQSILELQRDSSDASILLLNYKDGIGATEKKLSEIISSLELMRSKK